MAVLTLSAEEVFPIKSTNLTLKFYRDLIAASNLFQKVIKKNMFLYETNERIYASPVKKKKKAKRL